MTQPIVIVGAGPVGLLLACLLGRQNQDVILYEKRTGLPQASMAIGITPPSLDILDTLDLKNAFLERGVLIPRARVYEQGRPVGILDFRPSENQILSLPQFGTLDLLRQRLQSFPTVTFLEGTDREPAEADRHDGHIIACDGAHSPLRTYFNIPVDQKTYPVTFVMADFPDIEDLGPDARLFFSPRGAVESFPLPNRQRRWVAQCVNGAPPDLSTLRQRVQDAANINLTDRPHSPPCAFTPRRALARTFHKNNVILCGDAAHTLSPIGGQGMNTGFADAAHLARILPAPTAQALTEYTRIRRRAFRSASRRAAAGMFLGTRTGAPASRMRAAVLRCALRHPPTHQTLARTFAMRNPPPDFSRRATEAERMDSPDCDPAQLNRTLDQFHQINRLFSRARGLLTETVLADMQPGRAFHLVDLGAGACDLPVWLLRAAKRKNLDLHITAVDADPRAVHYARTRHGDVSGLTILQADALNLTALEPFDYLFANHFLHHLPDAAVEKLINDAARHCRRGFVFSDLRRSRWSYRGFSLFARVYRHSFARADGLLSIRKGFQPHDFPPSPRFTVRTRLPGRIQLLGGCFHTI
ncbi:MAG: FAD-dependent monooxygenase [Verrucomicrobia bacterium]|nr:FAD-dependent monooxygenase [Verrucomicrobiota bacterium]MCH8527404.1 FAD-dependent monooxygenase [Kiritimatiellia bacterium]